MTVKMPKDPSKKQVDAAIKKLQTSVKKKKGSIIHLFGSNPNEAEGLTFQKKARAEWD